MTSSNTDLSREIDALSGKFHNIHNVLSGHILGQQQVIDELLITLISGGHALLVGVPGLAKTRLVNATARVLGLDSQRVQFTPDLMPADILGSELLETGKGGERAFRFVEGPVFTELFLGDEINRASPRTQSALLQAMQEQMVSVAGETRPLGPPFHVLATQNPIEQEGTYPLPEAQLDRFLLQINITYPDLAAERDAVLLTTGDQEAPLTALMQKQELLAAQSLVRRMPLPETVVEAILALVRGLRPNMEDALPIAQHLSWGPGPRAAQALMLSVRARAFLAGEYAPSTDDVAALAPAALRHRMALDYKASIDGLDADEIISQALTLIKSTG